MYKIFNTQIIATYVYYLQFINNKTFYMQITYKIKVNVHMKYRREPNLRSKTINWFAGNPYKVLPTLGK
jgi:hypothetical protein